MKLRNGIFIFIGGSILIILAWYITGVVNYSQAMAKYEKFKTTESYGNAIQQLKKAYKIKKEPNIQKEIDYLSILSLDKNYLKTAEQYSRQGRYKEAVEEYEKISEYNEDYKNIAELGIIQ